MDTKILMVVFAFAILIAIGYAMYKLPAQAAEVALAARQAAKNKPSIQLQKFVQGVRNWLKEALVAAHLYG